MQCQECDKPLTPNQIYHDGKFCSRNCFGKAHAKARLWCNASDTTFAFDFWKFVKKGRKKECWPWLGATRGGEYPYGRFRRVGRRRSYTHQIAYELACGPIPQGAVVRHSCDNPLCCNPAHLLIGLPADNVRDMHERWRHEHGSRHHAAKLTETKIVEIRSLQGKDWPAWKVAKLYGVHPSVVYKIRWRKVWPHVR